MQGYCLRLLAAIFALAISLSPSLNAEAAEFYKKLSGKENKMTKSEFYKIKATSWLKNNSSQSINVIMGRPPCPSRWQAYYGNFDGEGKWLRNIKKDLKGFSKETIDYCTKVAYVVKDGQITEHPSAKDPLDRMAGSLFFRDKTTGKSFIIRVIQENDYRSKKEGGSIYNEALQKVCEYKFVNKTDDAIVKCVGSGIIAAKIEVLSVFEGKYRVFGENDSYIVLGSNYSVEEIKEKYPNLFPNEKNNKSEKKKCSFNCN